MKIQIEKTITTKELAKLIGLSRTLVTLHLCRLDKYRTGLRNHFLYIYNGDFLKDLLEFYITKAKTCYGERYEKYVQVVQKVKKMLELWNKAEKYRNSKTVKQD